jgi:hypothetical protein
MGFLRFLPALNNPWNLATARRSAAPGGQLLRELSSFRLKASRNWKFGDADTRF